MHHFRSITLPTKFLVFQAILLSLAGTACGQSKKTGIKITACYQRMMPGNIPVDDNGRPRQVNPVYSISVFAETGAGAVYWDSVRVDGHTYRVEAVAITNLPFSPGRKQSTQKPLEINPKKGATAWQLVLTPIGEFNAVEKPPQSITVYGRTQKAAFQLGPCPFIAIEGPSAV